MHFRYAVLALLMVLPTYSLSMESKRTPVDDVNYVDLAALMMSDGNYEKAANLLAMVDAEQDGLDRARFFLLRGLVRMNLGLYNQATQDLERAVVIQRDAAEKSESVSLDRKWYVYLGQARFYSEDYDGSLAALELAGEVGEAIPSTFALRAEAYRKTGFPERAWTVLADGMAQHPEHVELLRRQTFLAIELQLYRTAAELGQRYLSEIDATAQDYLAVGAALSRAGNAKDAMVFLELAQLRFPDSELVVSELARLYQGQQMTRTAAMMLERAALSGSDDLSLDAAELYRQSGDLVKALALNARVADSEKRLRQRLGILLELGRYELVAMMERDLQRVGLLNDESVRYAMAYAYFKTNQFAEADALLTGMKDASMFRQATELRKVMLDCQEDPWQCA